MFIKSIVLVTLAILIRGTLPRYRIDQLVSLHWKLFIFINIFFCCQLIFLNIILSLHSSVVERQTENLKVRSSILFVSIMFDKPNKYLILPIIADLSINPHSETYYLNKVNVIRANDFDIYRIFFVDTSNSYKFGTYRFYQMFNAIYLQSVYNVAVCEKNVNVLKTIPKKLVKIFSYKVQNISFKQFSIKYFNEVAYLFLISSWSKNLKPICKYIKKRLDNTHFKKHRSYFLFFFRILNKYIKPNFEQLKIKGLYLVFRGKLGRGGNSRKKVMFYKKGEYSLSNKLLAMNSHKWDIWTKTGSVGCTMRIFY